MLGTRDKARPGPDHGRGPGPGAVDGVAISDHESPRVLGPYLVQVVGHGPDVVGITEDMQQGETL